MKLLRSYVLKKLENVEERLYYANVQALQRRSFMSGKRVDCLILWHYFSARGKLMNASMTHLIGTVQNLQDRLIESHREASAAQSRRSKKPYVVAAQIHYL